MGKEYLISYTSTFHFTDEDVDINDKDLLSAALGDTMHEWLSDGGSPHPDNIKVEEFRP